MWFDEDVDILYISFRKGVSIHSEEKSNDIRVEYDTQGQIIGLEVANITEKLATPIAKHLSKAKNRIGSGKALKIA